MKLNLGCGNEKWEGFVNCDIEKALKPDKIIDLRQYDWDFDKESADEIWLSHTLEHIEKKYWENMFYEINRILAPKGNLYITFPEFSICAMNWIDNFRGKREYWEHTLYGRQLDMSDFHVSICDTEEILSYLRDYGFGKFKVGNDGEPQYSAVVAQKVRTVVTREDVYGSEIFRSG